MTTFEKPELSGDRFIELRLKGDWENEAYSVRINVCRGRFLCCEIRDSRPTIFVKSTERDIKEYVRSFLREMKMMTNKHGREYENNVWSVFHGETITYDIWKMDMDGEDFTECEDCGENQYDGEKLCKGCLEDRQNGYCGDCGNNKEPTGECFDCDISNNVVSVNPHIGLFTPESYELPANFQGFGTIINASFDVCMEKNREKVLY